MVNPCSACCHQNFVEFAPIKDGVHVFFVAQHGAELQMKPPHCLTVSCVPREEPFTDFHTLIPKILVCVCVCVPAHDLWFRLSSRVLVLTVVLHQKGSSDLTLF